MFKYIKPKLILYSKQVPVPDVVFADFTEENLIGYIKTLKDEITKANRLLIEKFGQKKLREIKSWRVQ